MTAHSRWQPDGRTRLLGIVGNPLEHTRSPELHSTVLRELERNLLYVPVPVSVERLRTFLALAPELGFLGLNVTTPYKERVFRWVEGDDESHRTRMVNTVLWRAGAAQGLSTDGAGILQWMRRSESAEPLGVLGFGPTARSLVHRSWIEGRPVRVVVTRRPWAVRRRLSHWQRDGLGPAGEVPLVLGWPSAATAERPWSPRIGEVRTWISTLPPETPVPVAFWRALDPRSAFLDLNYGSGRDGLSQRARELGHQSADGLGPLLEQAALSLSHWLGEEVPVELFHRAAGTSASQLRPH